MSEPTVPIHFAGPTVGGRTPPACGAAQPPPGMPVHMVSADPRAATCEACKRSGAYQAALKKYK